MTFGFIISTCIKEDIHMKQLSRCINSIRQFHPNNYIIVINDTVNTVQYNIDELLKNEKNLQIVNSIQLGSGELQTFKVLLETTLFDRAIIIQDSMILLQTLDNIENINLQFIWHFTNHRLYWDQINEPTTDYNIKNFINTHTDLIQDCILSDFRDNIEFQKFSLYCLKNKNKWVGCFGSCCIIHKKILEKIENTVPFINTFISYFNRRYRCSAESLFAIICHFVYPDINFSNSYDGLYYDGYNINPFNGQLCEYDNLKWCAKNKYIGKLSFNR